MDINNLIQIISSLEALDDNEKANLIKLLKSQGLTADLKNKIKNILEKELDQVNGKLAEEIDQSLSVAQKEADDELKSADKVLDQIEEAAARQKIADV